MTKNPEELNSNFLKQYYRIHSKIYDLTRWSFLFGRNTIIRELAGSSASARILEIGCGTGKNLVALCKAFPQAAISGVDLSDAMLNVARKNLGEFNRQVTLQQRSYNAPLRSEPPFDLILCSYSLSMFNPGWEEAIAYAYQDLADGGRIAVVDFHDSSFPGFKPWMRLNHVRMDGHLAPKLEKHFHTDTLNIRKAYAGVWSYFLFVGRKGA
jgi:S-adenosylmethionine-diacylgycerolhomoserine-N-methlytransferase